LLLANPAMQASANDSVLVALMCPISL